MTLYLAYVSVLTRAMYILTGNTTVLKVHSEMKLILQVHAERAGAPKHMRCALFNEALRENFKFIFRSWCDQAVTRDGVTSFCAMET